MNSEGKKILILGFISIAISAITLYSFRDVKFKNTKKLAEEYERHQVEIQNTIDNYDNTQNLYQNINEELPSTGTLTILMPEFLGTDGFYNLEKELESQNIFVKFDFISKISDLKRIVEGGLTDYDLYLLPSDWIEGLDLEGINLGENIKPYYNSFFQSILSDSENLFIPYSMDPLVIISKKGISHINSRNDIFSYITLWNQTKPFGMPLIRGIGDEDINLLTNFDESFENYFEILYWHLALIKDKQTLNDLNNMLDIERMEQPFKYNYDTFFKIFTRLNENNSYCKTFPGICVMAYDFGDIKFGFLSDFDILKKYFTEKYNNFEISSFINTDNIYPVRGWGFVIPKGNKNINLSKKFLMQYITTAIDGDSSLWNNTLPAIINIYNSKKNDQLYKDIILNEDKFYLFLEDVNLQEKFVSENKNIDLLRGIYSPNVYIGQ